MTHQGDDKRWHRDVRLANYMVSGVLVAILWWLAFRFGQAALAHLTEKQTLSVFRSVVPLMGVGMVLAFVRMVLALIVPLPQFECWLKIAFLPFFVALAVMAVDAIDLFVMVFILAPFVALLAPLLLAGTGAGVAAMLAACWLGGFLLLSTSIPLIRMTWTRRFMDQRKASLWPLLVVDVVAVLVLWVLWLFNASVPVLLAIALGFGLLTWLAVRSLVARRVINSFLLLNVGFDVMTAPFVVPWGRHQGKVAA